MKKEIKEIEYSLDESWLSAMATGLSMKFGVTIEKGDAWSANMEEKKITYDDTIKWLDKDNAIALLLHETGHLLNTNSIKETPIQKKYPKTTHFTINMLEDVRIDKIMSEAFGNSAYFMEKLNSQSEAMAKETLNGIANMINDLKSKFTQAQRDLEDVTRQRTEIEQLEQAMEDSMNYRKGVNAQLKIEEIKHICLKMGSTLANNLVQALNSMANAYPRGLVPSNTIWDIMQTSRSDIDNAISNIERFLQNYSKTLAQTKKDMLVKTCLFLAFMKLKNIKVTSDDVEATELGEEIFQVSEGVDLFNNTGEVQELFEKKVLPIIEHLLDEKEEQKQNSQKSGESQEKQNEILEKINKATKGMSLSQNAGSKEKRTLPPLNYNQAYRKLKPSLAGYISRYRRILKDNAFDRLGGRFRTGKLHKKGLYKVNLNEEKLFSRKIERHNKNYVFSIMIDDSGSMDDNNKKAKATDALVHLSEILHACNIPYEIGYFADDFAIAKEKHQTLDRVSVGYKASMADIGNGTRLLEPIEYMTKSLKEHKSPNKIGIVLTDGEINPAEKRQIQSMVRNLEKLPNATIYGIGIGCDIDSNAFGKDRTITCKDPSMIMGALKSILKTHIKTG